LLVVVAITLVNIFGEDAVAVMANKLNIVVCVNIVVEWNGAPCRSDKKRIALTTSDNPFAKLIRFINGRRKHD
jgi:hypothetical protein